MSDTDDADAGEEFFDKLSSTNELEFKELVETLLQCGKNDFMVDDAPPAKSIIFTKACPNLIYRPSDNPQAEYDIFCLDCGIVIHTSMQTPTVPPPPDPEVAIDADDEFFSKLGDD